jgi:hypothetical protein
MSHNEAAGPLASATGGHWPAGHVSPESWDAAQKVAVALEVDREQEEAAKAARENLIAERMASRRVPFQAPGAAPVEGNSAVDDGEKEVLRERF